MSNPYRDTRVADDSDELPEFCAKPVGWRDVVALALIYIAPIAVTFAVAGADVHALAVGLVLAPALSLTIACAILERPLRAWMKKRDAQRVVKGVALLEAKVAALDEVHDRRAPGTRQASRGGARMDVTGAAG